MDDQPNAQTEAEKRVWASIIASRDGFEDRSREELIMALRAFDANAAAGHVRTLAEVFAFVDRLATETVTH